jgi:autotransporter-associated beta strand protein
MGGADTGALRLSGGITSAEFIFLTCRTTADNPHLRNDSGSNTLTGQIEDDNNIDGFTVISSDGTAGGDLLTIAGNVVRSAIGTNSSELVLRGSGNGVISGNITQTTGGNWSALTKAGDGTWTLSGANDYVGTTNVSAGKLIINGTHTGGAYTVGASGTLGGNGSITAPLVTVDGVLSPGNSIDQMSIAGDVTINGNFLLETDLAGNADRLDVSGTLTLGGSSVLDLDSLSSLNASLVYTIASYTTLGGTFATVDPTILSTHSVDYVTGNEVRLVPVPEPHSIGLGLFCLASVAWRAVRRRPRQVRIS